MITQRLARDATFVSLERRAWTLPAGTAVEIGPVTQPSPLTGRTDEPYVSARDPESGRRWYGWLAVSTRYGTPPTSNGRGHRLSALDELRSYVASAVPRGGFDRFGYPIRPYDLKLWLCRFGSKHSTLLTRVHRELSRKKPSTDAFTLVSRVIALTAHEEVSVTDVQETQAELEREESVQKERSAAKAKKGKAKTKAPAKAAKAKTAKKSDGNDGRSASVNLGTALVGTGALKGDALASARALQSGAPLAIGKLRALKDSVKEAAAGLREAKKPAQASTLSSLNRTLRRIIRAS